MSRSFILSAFLCSLSLSALLSGCSPRSQPLARVGDATITVEEFQEVASTAASRYPGLADSAKALLLDDLVRRELLIQEAKRRGLEQDSMYANQRRKVEEQAMLDALGSRLGPGAVPVSDAELERFYAMRNVESHAQIVFASDDNFARSAMADLKRGVAFEVVANRYNPPGLIPPGGDVGFVQPGTLVNPLDEELRTAPIGQLVGPMPAPGGGSFFIRVIERRPKAQPPFETQRVMLQQMLSQRKQRAVSKRAFDDLKAQYRLRLELGAAEVLFQRANVEKFSDQALPEPPAEEQRRALARYDGAAGDSGVFTLGDALHYLGSESAEPPNFQMMPMIAQWIESQALRRIALIEARRRHLAEEPEVARRIQQQLDAYLLDAIYTSEVMERVDASEEEVMAVYRQRATQLARMQSARVAYVTVKDSAMAHAVREHVGSSGTLREAAATASPSLAVREQEVTYPTEDRVWGPLEDTLAGMEPGATTAPLLLDGSWMIIQLLSKRRDTPAFESLPQGLQQAMRNDALELKREQRLAEFTESLKRSFPVTIDRERLKTVRWMPFGLPGGLPQF